MATITTATGAGGQNLSTFVNLGNTAHSSASTYASDSWTFSGDPNYNNIGPTTITDIISPANADIVVTPYDVPYDTNTHVATVTTATGAGGQNLSTFVNLGNTAHSYAGTYATDSWSFSGDPNYNSIPSTTIEDIISSVNADIVVTAYTVPYDGNQHLATITTATGAGGQNLSSFVNLGNTAHTNAGTYATDSWSFSGDPNYNSIPSTTIEDIISSVNADIVVTAYNVPYDGNPHTATGTATGVGGLNLLGAGDNLNLSGTVHTNGTGGGVSDPWTFTDTTGNYNSTSSTVSDEITPIGQTINFTAPASPIPFVANGTVNLLASAPGGTVAFSIDNTSTGSGSINGNVLTVTGAGSIVLDANQGGDSNYQAAPQVQQTLVISPLVDVTPPTSKVNTLSVNQSSDTFPVTVTSSDPVGANNAPPSGVATVDLYYSTNGGTTWSLYQTLSGSLAASPGFSFNGQDRTTYDFYSVAHDVAGNTQIEPNPPAIQASTQVPEINLPVSHVLGASPASQAWSPFPSSDFSSLQPSAVNLTKGTITLNWAAVEPDHILNTPAIGTIQTVSIYVEVDGGAPTLVTPAFSAGSPNANGVYSGTISYGMLGDGSSHTYIFYSVASDDYGKSQLAPPTPDVTFTATYTAVPAPTAFTVDNQNVQGESFIGSLAVTFNQPTANLSKLNTAVNTTKNVSGYVELLYYGKSLTGSSPVKTTVIPPAADVAFANSGGFATLSLNFGTGGVTSLFGGSATTNADDGWYLLGIDPYDNPSQNVVFWEPFYRLLGDVTSVGTVSGGVTTTGSDVNLVYYAKGSSQVTGLYDVDGGGLLSNTQVAEVNGNVGATVGTTKPTPPASGQFQLFAGAAGPGSAAALSKAQVQPVLAEAISSWKAVGVNAAGIQLMEQTHIAVTDLGTSILGLEAPGEIWINSTAAGYNWYIGGGAASHQAFGNPGPGGGPAAGQVDLLTVLEHELGHVLGLGDNGITGDLMDVDLGLGERRTPTALDAAAIAQAFTMDNSATLTPLDPSLIGPRVVGNSTPGGSLLAAGNCLFAELGNSATANLVGDPGASLNGDLYANTAGGTVPASDGSDLPSGRGKILSGLSEKQTLAVDGQEDLLSAADVNDPLSDHEAKRQFFNE